MAGQEEPSAVDRLDVAPGRAGRAAPWLLLAVGVALALVTVLVVAPRSGSGADAGPPGARPDESGSSSAAASPPGTGAPAPETVRDGPALRQGVPADHVVWARGEDAVFGIALGTGRITRWRATRLDVGGQETLVATRGAVLAVRDDSADALRLYGDGQPERRPGGDFGQANQILPAADGRFWIVRGAGGPTSNVSPVGPDGVVRESLDVRGTVGPGGGGELLMDYLGRTWRIGPDLDQTAIGGGTVLAVGADHLLVGECGQDACRQRLTDRDGAAGVAVAPGPVPADDVLGQISPDGRWVARTVPGSEGRDVTRLVELATGRVVAETVGGTAVGPAGLGTASAWLPDASGYLVLDDGRLSVLEPGTGDLSSLDLDLPPLLTLAFAG